LEREKIWECWGLETKTYSPNFVNFGTGVP